MNMEEQEKEVSKCPNCSKEFTEQRDAILCCYVSELIKDYPKRTSPTNKPKVSNTREKLRKYYEKNAFTKNTMFGFDDVVEFAEIHANDVTTSQKETIERLRNSLQKVIDSRFKSDHTPFQSIEEAEELLKETEP